MSHRAVQHLMVHLLFDPTLIDQLRRDARATLDRLGVELSETELGWIMDADPRAWRTDPLRRERALTGLADEYPASLALALRTAGLDAILAFFASPAFRRCVKARGSMAIDFGRWMTTVFNGTERPVARIELAIARVRRGAASATGDVDARPHDDPRPANTPTAEGRATVTLAPTVDCALVPDGTVEHMAAVRAALAKHPAGTARATLDLDRTLPRALLERALPANAELEAVIVDRGPEGPQIGFASEPLVRLLERARAPLTLSELWAYARTLGADPGDDREIVGGLVTDGLLQIIESPAPLRVVRD